MIIECIFSLLPFYLFIRRKQGWFVKSWESPLGKQPWDLFKVVICFLAVSDICCPALLRELWERSS